MNILGLMSGSSLDGLDMALCHFSKNPDDNLAYEMLAVEEVPFPSDLQHMLSDATALSAYDLCLLEAQFTSFLGQCCTTFKSKYHHKIDVIASHGHTVFHAPESGFTTQLGNGGALSQFTECDVVSDFRSSDVAAGGQGAPFAPIADQLLFPNADIMLNLGGINNISWKDGNNIKALDISPANQLLNFLAAKLGLPYDDGGEQARKGKIIPELLKTLKEKNQLNNLQPRGMDNSWVVDNFTPLLHGISEYNGLRTVLAFISDEIVKTLTLAYRNKEARNMIITGGGALNTFLVDEIRRKVKTLNVEIQPVSEKLIKYKEAVLMALMGYLRIHRKENVLSSYTGAEKNSIGGCIYVY